MINELDMNKGSSGRNIIFDGTSNSLLCTILFFVPNPQNAIFTYFDGKLLAPIQWVLVCNGSYIDFIDFIDLNRKNRPVFQQIDFSDLPNR